MIMNCQAPGARATKAFTLIELLICIAVMALLLSLLAPSLSGVRESGRQTACLVNLRSMTTGWTMYSNTYNDRCMPLAYSRSPDIAIGAESIYWWGTHGITDSGVDHDKGFLSPFLDSSLSAKSVYECPCQPWGTYRAQGNMTNPQRTSTYGYNGYYFASSQTPGWDAQIAGHGWLRQFQVRNPSSTIVFADTLLSGSPPSNCALLDPPQLYAGRRRWSANTSPTTAFRHFKPSAGVGGATSAAHADCSVQGLRADPSWIVDQKSLIGSVGTDLACYVPDWSEWR
jgi:prepilin-type N-terminal cleavage/methylation domain-containing protein